MQGCEHALLFETALRVLKVIRETYAQRHEAMVGEQLEEIVEPVPATRTNSDERGARSASGWTGG